MRRTKRTLSVIAATAAIVLAATWSFAGGHWGKRGYGYPKSGYGWYSSLSPEQREKVQAQQEKFLNETAELRRELYQKRLEMRRLLADPKVDPGKAKAKQHEIFDLERQLGEKALENRLASQELFSAEGFDPGPWSDPYGYGPHHGWDHRTWGHGFRAGRGYGRGPCGW
jgi:Spy/CpxP family protein refolding chaperone